MICAKLRLEDGRKVYTGRFNTDVGHLESLREKSAYISDIGFYKKGPLGGERVAYDVRLAKKGELRLWIQMWRVNAFCRDKISFSIDGLENMLSILKELGVENPELVERAKGRKVVTFRDPFKEPLMSSDPVAVWGVYVPCERN